MKEKIIEKPAIVVSTHNRPHSLRRILSSLKSAVYDNFADIPLVISIDRGGSEFEIISKIADEFEWKYGEKKVIKHTRNLGLRNHIISCGDLSEEFGSVIILEDDLFVSRNFYKYAASALDFYKNDSNIGGISLYNFEYNENAALPFKPLIDGNEVYFIQVPSSWGQAWTSEQWKKFKKFYDENPEITALDKLPENVKNWPESSWKKYFYKYIIDNELYFVCPIYSFTTNFGDIGVHYSQKTEILQTSLEYYFEFENFKFISFQESFNKYDGFFEISADSLIKLGAKIKIDTCIDLYGTKQLNRIDNKYLLSVKKCSTPISIFGGNLEIALNNILYNSKGEEIYYGDRKNFFEDKSWPQRAGNVFFGKFFHKFKDVEKKRKLANVEISILNSELNSIKLELKNVEHELNQARISLNGIYASREWRIVLGVQSFVKLIFPSGSIRRRMAVLFWRSLKVIIESVLKVKGRIFAYFILRKDIKNIKKNERRINIESRKIAFIDHSFHKKTGSSKFLIDYLKEFFDVEVYFDESWKGNPFIDLSFIDESYHGVIFWQSLPDHETLAKINNENIMFFPMYDQSRNASYEFWRNYRNVKFVNFSKALHEKLKKWKFETMHVQYFPQLHELIPGKEKEAFFWQRLTDININIIEKILKNSSFRLHIHKAVDPNQQFIQPTKEQCDEFNIEYSEWFENKNDLRDIIKEKAVYIAPREYEGIGMSFLEAMAMGKAVIAVNNPTMNEYIRHGKTGYLFDLKNPKEIDFSEIKNVQKNTYEFMKKGYQKWEKNKCTIIEFIRKI